MPYKNITALIFIFSLAACDNNNPHTNTADLANGLPSPDLAPGSETKSASVIDASIKSEQAQTTISNANQAKEAATIISPSTDPLTIARQSGCLACHHLDKKLVGPAWRDVSAHYSSRRMSRALLIAKVKTGGKGNWTEITGGAPMPPYSPRVSDENIALLVDFILSLNQ